MGNGSILMHKFLHALFWALVTWAFLYFNFTLLFLYEIMLFFQIDLPQCNNLATFFFHFWKYLKDGSKGFL